MSYILEALRKADAERERGSVPDLHAQTLPLSVSDAEVQRPRPSPALWLGLGVGLAAAAATAWYFLARDESATDGAPCGDGRCAADGRVAAARTGRATCAFAASCAARSGAGVVRAEGAARRAARAASAKAARRGQDHGGRQGAGQAFAGAEAGDVRTEAGRTATQGRACSAAGAGAGVGRVARRAQAAGADTGRRRLGLLAAGECAHGGHQRPGVPGRQQPGAGTQAGAGSPEDGRVFDTRPALRSTAVDQRPKPPPACALALGAVMVVPLRSRLLPYQVRELEDLRLAEQWRRLRQA